MGKDGETKEWVAKNMPMRSKIDIYYYMYVPSLVQLLKTHLSLPSLLPRSLGGKVPPRHLLQTGLPRGGSPGPTATGHGSVCCVICFFWFGSI